MAKSVKVPVSDLSERQLIYAVAKTLDPSIMWGKDMGISAHHGQVLVYKGEFWNPCRDWSVAGPIIEANGISFRQYWNPKSAIHGTYFARVCRESGEKIWWAKNDSKGKSPLEASMRAFVSAHNGQTISIPEELV